MTPMIDVVFQLLIYFVLTFEIPDVLSQMALYRPAPDSPPSDAPPPVDSMRVTVYENGVFALNDTRVGLATMQRKFDRAAKFNKKQPIIVVATAQSFHRDLCTVLDMLNYAGLETITLISSD